jgi:Skp family chaperone for outer membrane proteins
MNRMFLALIVLGITFTPASLMAQTAQSPLSVALTKVSADKANAVKPVPPGGRPVIAVVNIGVVFNKYQRAVAFKEQMTHEMKESQEEAKQLTQDITVWKTAVLQQNDFSAAKREQYEKKIINAMRQLEDLQRQVRSKVGKTQEANLIVLWKDVRAAVKTYATEHGIQVVFAFADPKESELVDLFPNVTRKMQALDQGGSTPLFTAPGADISEAVAELLNRQYREKSKAEPAEEEEP